MKLRKTLSIALALILAFQFFLISPQTTYADLTTGLVSCWSFDEASGDRADSYGSNNLSPVNTPGATSSVFGSAVTLNAASNQYLQITDAAQSGLDITGDMTWYGLIQYTTFANTINGIVSKYDTGAGGTASFLFDHFKTGGNVHRADVLMFDSGATFHRDTDDLSNGNLSTGTWYSYVVIYDASAQTVEWYINGVGEATSTSMGTSIYNSTHNFVIGRGNKADVNQDMDGYIDEFAIWNVALTPSDVQTIFNSGSFASCDNIINGFGGGGGEEATTSPSSIIYGRTSIWGNTVFGY